MAKGLSIDRKARSALVAASLLIAGASLLPAAKFMAARVREKAEHVFFPADDQLVGLPNGSTILLLPDSTERRIADWLNLTAAGEQTFQVVNEDFTAASAVLSRRGWQDLAQLAHLLEAYRGATIVVISSPRYGDIQTLPLERMRAARIRNELVKFGIDEDRVAVRSDAFGPPEGLALLVATKHR